jgi:uncharacterized protein (TIGR02646 family)
MNKIHRLPEPDCLNDQIAESKQKKIQFYQDLRDSSGKIKPRWNSTCKEGGLVSKIRLTLLEMSNHCCAYCGVKIDNTSMDVDHYLPSSEFPYLAYCWDNLLPTCKKCNQNMKSDFCPQSLRTKKIVEQILSEQLEHDLIYDKAYLLSSIAQDDRLIEPSYDNPEEHLAFNPEFYFYESRTKIGSVTNVKFFKHKEVACEWEKLSRFVRALVQQIQDQQLILETLKLYTELHGQEYVCMKFYEYWITEREQGRIIGRD